MQRRNPLTPEQGGNIFDLLHDTRSARSKAWCFTASIGINASILALLIAAAQVYAVRTSARRMITELQRGLAGYRLVMLDPGLAKPAKSPVRTDRRPEGPKPSAPRPLAVPDPRLLQLLNSNTQDFVRKNPEIETILTREVVRDIDTGVLDVSKLLERSSLEIGFEVDAGGAVRRPRVLRSSRVPSIDHLVLEAATLLEKYHLLDAYIGLERIRFSVEIGDQIVVKLAGEVSDEAGLIKLTGQVRNFLAFMRLGLAQTPAAFVLEGVVLEVQDTHLTLSKAFDKNTLISFLKEYCQAEAIK